MKRKSVGKEARNEAVPGVTRVSGGRVPESREGPEIAADPAFWLKDVFDNAPNRDERG